MTTQIPNSQDRLSLQRLNLHWCRDIS